MFLMRFLMTSQGPWVISRLRHIANAHGFSLHAGVRCDANDRKGIEQLCRYITRPVIANERLSVNREGNVVLKLKTPYRNGAIHIVMSPMESTCLPAGRCSGWPHWRQDRVRT